VSATAIITIATGVTITAVITGITVIGSTAIGAIAITAAGAIANRPALKSKTPLSVTREGFLFPALRD
jgi:hypothetical protein